MKYAPDTTPNTYTGYCSICWQRVAKQAGHFTRTRSTLDDTGKVCMGIVCPRCLPRQLRLWESTTPMELRTADVPDALEAFDISILIACSASKLTVPARADTIYTGPLWQTWREHCPESLPPNWRLFAVSALHGLIPANRVIEPYDQVLSLEDLDQVAQRVSSQWRGTTASRVLVVGGRLYQRAVKRARLPVAWRIDGTASEGQSGGIGLLRQRLAAWLAGDLSGQS